MIFICEKCKRQIESNILNKILKCKDCKCNLVQQIEKEIKHKKKIPEISRTVYDRELGIKINPEFRQQTKGAFVRNGVVYLRLSEE